MKELDARHLACPGPVIEARRLLDAGNAAVRVRVADALARSNVTRFAASRGARAVSDEQSDGSFVVLIEQAEDACPIAETLIAESESASSVSPESALQRGPRVVQVPGDTMGHGDDELGRILLRGFLKTQLQLDRPPDAVIFYNTGVRICCEGSPLIEDLRALEERGVEIIACGTCLNFFGLAAALRVGRVTDMLEIASRLADAGSIVRP